MAESTARGSLRSPHKIRILFSEGSSLSARQALTALGSLGYCIDICDPNPYCLCRFSRFVRHYYRSPGLGHDPVAYLDFVLDRLTAEHYDVLFPTHEQALLFARVQPRLTQLTGVALPSFESLAVMQSKVTFARLLTEMGLPQPATCELASAGTLLEHDDYPYYVKTAYSTAGRGVWRVADAVQRSVVADDLGQREMFAWGVLRQSEVHGQLCQAQAIFERGILVATHCTTQRAVGVGGSQAARSSIDHPVVVQHLQQIGTRLDWHGALTLDYFFDPETGQVAYIEANPRLVEPMNAVMSGVNLAEMLVKLSLGESLIGGEPKIGASGIDTHSVVSVLMGVAQMAGGRRELLRTLAQALMGRGVFANSREDLTPGRLDLPSLVLPLAAAVALLLKPSNVHSLAGGAISHYSVTPQAVEIIQALR